MCIHPTVPPVLLAGTLLCRSPTASPPPLRKDLGPKRSVLYPSQHQCLLPLSRGIQPAGQKAINHQKSTLQGAELHFVCHSHRAAPPVSVQTLHLVDRCVPFTDIFFGARNCFREVGGPDPVLCARGECGTHGVGNLCWLLLSWSHQPEQWGYSTKTQGSTLKGWQIVNTVTRTAFQRAHHLSQLKVSYKLIVAEHKPSLLAREEVLLWPAAPGCHVPCQRAAKDGQHSSLARGDQQERGPSHRPCFSTSSPFPFTAVSHTPGTQGLTFRFIPSFVLVPLCSVVTHGPTSTSCPGHRSKGQDTERVWRSRWLRHLGGVGGFGESRAPSVHRQQVPAVVCPACSAERNRKQNQKEDLSSPLCGSIRPAAPGRGHRCQEGARGLLSGTSSSGPSGRKEPGSSGAVCACNTTYPCLPSSPWPPVLKRSQSKWPGAGAQLARVEGWAFPNILPFWAEGAVGAGSWLSGWATRVALGKATEEQDGAGKGTAASHLWGRCPTTVLPCSRGWGAAKHGAAGLSVGLERTWNSLRVGDTSFWEARCSAAFPAQR